MNLPDHQRKGALALLDAAFPNLETWTPERLAELEAMAASRCPSPGSADMGEIEPDDGHLAIFHPPGGQ